MAAPERPPKAFLHTPTSDEQAACEANAAELYADLAELEPGEERDEALLLLRDRHARYLQGGLGSLPGGFISLDASRPWIVYWVVHGLALLGAPLPAALPAADVVAFLAACQHPSGGFGGGPGQLPHLAPTYAAVGALLSLGGADALGAIDRRGVWSFLCRMAVPPEQGGGFRMHEGGECDARACYTALAVASNLRLDVAALARRSGAVDYLRRCQTYEGGLGGEPGNEAHGGYTFCGLAALCLAGAPHALDLPALLHWAAQRQGWVEGGFNGRTNKLVDGCYSFWQGGVFPLLQQLLAQQAPARPVPAELDACCAAPSYPPREPPPGWQQQGGAGAQQQPLLRVPPLPDLSRVRGPVEQAAHEAEHLNAASELLASAALAAGSGGEAGDDAAAAAAATGTREPRAQLLQRAQAAQEAADAADEALGIAQASAAVLYPLPLRSGSSSNGSADSSGSASSNGSASEPQQQQAAAAAAAPNPCFNAAALQCWILRACQQLKGGLRDKPGKPADFYHTCYCLSGLSAAQHIPGGCVLGPARNRLQPADPLVNIVTAKLAEARAFFDAQGPLPGGC